MRNTVTKLFTFGCISLALFACVTPIDDFPDKTSWLKKNFPNRSDNIEKIRYDEKYKQNILDGVIVNNMSWDETLVAADVNPFGPKTAGKVFWCNQSRVDHCTSECVDCRAMLVRKREVHFFETGQRGLQLVATVENHKWPPHLSYSPTSYNAARAIFRDEYVQHMHFDDIIHVNQPAGSNTYYYCGGENRNRSDIPCSADCQRCRVEVHIPASRDNPPRLIELFFEQQLLQRIQKRDITVKKLPSNK